MRAVNFQAPIRYQSPLNKGLLRWWMAEPSRTGSPRLQDLTRKSPITLTGALRLGPRGRVGGAGSSVFDGTDDRGQTAAIDLSGISTMTVAMWMYWVYSNNSDIMLESSADFNSNTGAFVLGANNAGGSFDLGIRTGVGTFNYSRFTRPSGSVWHHYAFCFNRGGGATQIPAVYVDGVSQSLTPVFADTTGTGGFGNYVWNFMSRNATSNFGEGFLDDVRIYNRVLPAWEVKALKNASRRGYLNELRWSRGAEFGGYIDEAPPEDPYVPYSVPYHRRSFKAMAPIKNAGHAMSSLSSAVALTTIPGNALRARVVGVSGSATVYFREDSGTPSSSNGTPIGAGGYADIVGRNNLEGFRAIEASPSGTLWVEYFDSVE